MLISKKYNKKFVFQHSAVYEISGEAGYVQTWAVINKSVTNPRPSSLLSNELFTFPRISEMLPPIFKNVNYNRIKINWLVGY